VYRTLPAMRSPEGCRPGIITGTGAMTTPTRAKGPSTRRATATHPGPSGARHHPTPTRTNGPSTRRATATLPGRLGARHHRRNRSGGAAHPVRPLRLPLKCRTLDPTVRRPTGPSAAPGACRQRIRRYSTVRGVARGFWGSPHGTACTCPSATTGPQAPSNRRASAMSTLICATSASTPSNRRSSRSRSPNATSTDRP
jgi:hypothetical protein